MISGKGSILCYKDQRGGLKTKEKMRTIAQHVRFKTLYISSPSSEKQQQNSRLSTKTQAENHLERHLGPNSVHMREKRDEKKAKSVNIKRDRPLSLSFSMSP